MYRAVGDEEMVVLAGRPAVDVLFRLEGFARLLCAVEGGNHFRRVGAGLQAEVDGGSFFRIEQVITFVLCVVDAECVADILRGGMDLKAQVSAAHGIEEIETDGKVLSETRLHGAAEQGTSLIENQIVGRYFEQFAIDLQEKAVLFRYAVEAPAVVGLFRVESAHFFHPLSAPWCRVEKRHDTEWSPGGLFEAEAQRVALDHLRVAGNRGV